MRPAIVLACLWTAPAVADDAVRPVEVPFELLASRHMAVSVRVNGEGPFRMVFDTGAPAVLVSTHVAKSAELRERSRQSVPGVKIPAGQLRIDELEIGPLRVEMVPAIAFDHPTVAAMSKVVGPLDGIVGFPVFARYRTAIDYQAKRITFTPNGYQPGDIYSGLMKSLAARSKAAVIAPAGQWGLTVDKGASDRAAGVTVTAVYEGGAAAEAGIVVGDRLLTIDGRWTDSADDCLRAAAAVPPGRAVPVTLRRDGRDLRLTVVPRAGL